MTANSWSTRNCGPRNFGNQLFLPQHGLRKHSLAERTLQDLLKGYDKVRIVNYKPMIDQQTDSQQGHWAIVRDDLYGALFTKPVQSATVRFQRYFIAVSKTCTYSGTL